MAIGQMTWPLRALDREAVILGVTFSGNGTAAPTLDEGSPGVTVARTGAGTYDITVPEGATFVAGQATLVSNGAVLVPRISAVEAGTITVETLAASVDEAAVDWTKTDLDGEGVSLIVILTTSREAAVIAALVIE